MFSNKFGEHENVECGLVFIIPGKDKGDDPEGTAPVPLESVNIVASVVHAVAQVELTQVFVNKEEQPIEAIYFFPVDSNGGITHFHAELEGRTIKGTVKPQEDAKAQYEKAVKEKQTAFLVESNKPDIFKVRIGFLKPGSKVKIVIGYVAEVKNEKGSNAQRFFIPTTVAPRYVPPEDEDDKSEELRTMKFSENSPAPLSISVNVALQGGIKLIECPTHKVTIKPMAPIPQKPNWTREVVELSGKTTDMDRDFVLLITPDEVHTPRLYMEKLEKGTALMSHLIPSFQLKDQKVELIFVLDRSGSMMGRSIDLAKRALALFLHSAPVDSYFNIVGFGSSFQFLFPESVKYEDGSMKKAIQHAKSLQANLGGTELLQPLKKVFAKSPVPGYLRQIFVLTDGEISNTDAVIGLVKANAHLGRLFSLGIGAASSHHLVEGLAEAGGGTSCFVTYNESLDSKVLQQLKNAIQPSLANVTVSWTGISESVKPVKPEVSKQKTLVGYGKPVAAATEATKMFSQVPEKVPPIYDGSQLLVFGLFEKEVPSGVTITAESPDGPLSIEMKLDAGNDLGSNGMIHKLSAIKLIRELEIKIGSLSSGNKNTVDVLKKEIIGISCKHGISSKYTSFVAVDTTPEGEKAALENWAMQTRHVPSQFAHGWHGHGGHSLFGGSVRRSARCKGRASGSKRSGALSRSSSRGSRCSGSIGGSAKRRMVTCGSSAPGTSSSEVAAGCSIGGAPMPKEIKALHDCLHAIVGTQSFNGSFTLTDAFCKGIGKDMKELKKGAKNGKFDETAFATALALAYFTQKLNALKDSWELVELKAKKWLENNFPANHAAIMNAATKLIQA